MSEGVSMWLLPTVGLAVEGMVILAGAIWLLAEIKSATKIAENNIAKLTTAIDKLTAVLDDTQKSVNSHHARLSVLEARGE